MKKYTIIKKFGSVKKGGSIWLHDFQVSYFVGLGMIEDKTKQTNKVDKVVNDSKNSKNNN